MSVAWLAKSQNIHFDGKKGNYLTERMHSFLKQKAENASPAELDLERPIESLLADDCDDVNDDTFKESLSERCDVAKESENQHSEQASIAFETGTKHDELNAKLKNLH